ncbi:hypothetical protein ESCO_004752 [Escovopsis weberi]|uniref:Uncharacterized protein n=1 Tax=Escovopsis weberi TaxID=150374 RepID=A0A0M9VRP9_ESCWE|nr:hypothetical protein ESCO_004752 [Escovopsis weberi]
MARAPLTTTDLSDSSKLRDGKGLSNFSSDSKHILAQADAIARMTIELNLRAVAAQADRLERELKALVECTARDRAFRDKHEQRLEDMWREMLAVKQRMGEFQARSAADVERCRAQTARAMDLLRGEAGRLRALVDDVGGALDRLSAGDSSQGEEAGGDREADEALKRRVRETLSSTRRWNRDHKTTSLGDPAFVARYLKQQSKRDPRMAVLIQRALQKRIARRGGGGGADGNSGNGNSSNAGNSSRRKARPQSLEQLCEDLVWKDVIETVEEVLVRAEAGVLRALR